MIGRPRETLEYRPVRLVTTAGPAGHLARHVALVVVVVEALHALGLA